MKRRLFATLIGLVALGGAPLAQAVCDKPLTFGVVPQQSATKLAGLWGPLLREVSERSGCTLSFRTAPNIPEFEKRLANGEYDFAYMNPYHYTVFGEVPGYVAFGRARDRQIKGIMVVRRDSPIQSMEAVSYTHLTLPTSG